MTKTTKMYLYREILHRYADGSYTTGQFRIAEKLTKENPHWLVIGSIDVTPVTEEDYARI